MNPDPRDAISLAERQAFLLQATRFAASSREIILSVVQSGFEVQAKADKTLVTTADIEVERVIREEIVRLYPDHGVLGEEFSEHNPGAEYCWIIDPVDGTEAFANGIPTYGTVLSLYYQGQPLVGVLDNPGLDLCTVGGYGLGVSCNGKPLNQFEDIRAKSTEEIRLIVSKRKNFSRYGEDRVFEELTREFPNILVFDSCYAYTALAHGSVDAIVDYNVRLWDVSAALALVPELGGSYEILEQKDRGDGIQTLSVALGKQHAVDLIREAIS